jgi:hypothetical protein
MAKPADPDDFEVVVSMSDDDADLTPPPMGLRGSALPIRPFPVSRGPDSQGSDVDSTLRTASPQGVAPLPWMTESTRLSPMEEAHGVESSTTLNRGQPAPVAARGPDPPPVPPAQAAPVPSPEGQQGDEGGSSAHPASTGAAREVEPSATVNDTLVAEPTKAPAWVWGYLVLCAALTVIGLVVLFFEHRLLGGAPS